MKFNVIFTALVAVAVSNVKAELAMCKQDYNQGSSLQCGPNHPPCVALKDEGKFIDHPNKPLNCDKQKKVCQYPEYSKMSVQCNQGKVDVTLAGANNSFVNHANNAFAYFVSNQCTQPSDMNSKQNGDTLVVDCNPIKGNGGKCTPDYAFNRNMTAKANFECGPGKADCVTIVGEGEIIQSPNKADACDPSNQFCSFPKYSKLTVKCNQGTVTAQFAGKKNTFQNHAQNSLAYWMSNKCKGPSKNLSDQDGDLLVVDCNPLAPQHTNSWSFNH